MLNSLRNRLVLAIGALQVVTWLAILGVGGMHMWHELEEGYEAQLAQFALSAGAMVDALTAEQKTTPTVTDLGAPRRTTTDPYVIPRGVSTHNFESSLVQVSKNGRMLFRSSTAPAQLVDTYEGIGHVDIDGDI